jgi:hypothetical protein
MMAVYVDDASIPATVPNGRVRHTSRWSHLFADTQEELHEFAERLGLRRSYFQPGRPRGDGRPSPHWHYDVTTGKRQQAIKLGAQPISWRESTEIMRKRDAKAERGKVADQAAHAAGLAYRAGDYVRASRLLNIAREADPSRAALWAERAGRVHAAVREKAVKVAGPDDPQPLAEVVSARLEAASLTADSPELRLIARWNAERLAAAVETEPNPEPEGQIAPRAQPDLLTDTEREAAG